MSMPEARATGPRTPSSLADLVLRVEVPVNRSTTVWLESARSRDFGEIAGDRRKFSLGGKLEDVRASDDDRAA